MGVEVTVSVFSLCTCLFIIVSVCVLALVVYVCVKRLLAYVCAVVFEERERLTF